MKIIEQLKKDGFNEIVNHAIDKLKDGVCSNTYCCDVHNEIFNTDYFIIGYYDAEQWLIKNIGIFNAIEIIKDYEQDNFGEVSTNLSSSESVVNMFVYIAGEEILNECEVLSQDWNELMSEETKNELIEELENLIK